MPPLPGGLVRFGPGLSEAIRKRTWVAKYETTMKPHETSRAATLISISFWGALALAFGVGKPKA